MTANAFGIARYRVSVIVRKSLMSLPGFWDQNT